MVRGVRRFRLQLQVKGAPGGGPAIPPMDPAADPAAAADPNAGQPPMPTDDSRPWAGDLYDEGDETLPDDPSVTDHFSDPNGEEAWLEKAPDGTLTGWVRDATGQVYRYSDADAWATDVDDAGMTPSGGGAPAPGDMPDGEERDGLDEGDDEGDLPGLDEEPDDEEDEEEDDPSAAPNPFKK